MARTGAQAIGPPPFLGVHARRGCWSRGPGGMQAPSKRVGLLGRWIDGGWPHGRLRARIL